MPDLIDKKSVTREELERIAWRRAMKIAMRGEFDEKYPEDVLTAFLVTGMQYFDRDILVARKRELVGFKPFQTISNGQARLFHQRVPGRRYVIGADPVQGVSATGNDENLDYAAAVVKDLETGEEMAAYRARVTPVDFAFDLADLGRYYNDAIISVERTGDGGTCILTLVNDCGYGAIYKHREWHKRYRQLKMVDFEGFPTTPRTRPVALNFLNQFVTDHPELVWDTQFIDEALVFVRKPEKKGIPSAHDGAHDDTVACRWIAEGTRRALLGYWTPADHRKEGYVSADRLPVSGA